MSIPLLLFDPFITQEGSFLILSIRTSGMRLTRRLSTDFFFQLAIEAAIICADSFQI